MAENKSSSNNILLIIMIFLLANNIFSTLAATRHDDDRRNVLLIIADDAGFEMGAYGNYRCRTPHLDSLAGQSVIFNRARTSVSSCSPSRAALLTGLPVHQNGLYGLHHDVHHYNSFEGVQTLPKILRDSGIRTGIVGKKHVGPASAFAFDYEETEENNSIMQVGRNITRIKLLVRDFLQQANETQQPFFLYVAFHDPHRCDHSNPGYGHFCDRFGDGHPGNGLIPDWTPQRYSPDEVLLPYFVPDTPAAREDLASQYTTISRLDQGVGLVLEELSRAGKKDNTLVIYSSDNGISFPAGRTNMYEPGLAVPLLIQSPLMSPEKRGKETDFPASLLDLVPTVLDWYGVEYPKYHILKPSQPTTLSGRSLLPVVLNSDDDSEVLSEEEDSFYGSHVAHEVTMDYPMRTIVLGSFKLVHNFNYRSPFPIDQDFYMSPTFQDMLNRTIHGRPLHWFKSLDEYYFREEWEFYDLEKDPQELVNLHHKKKYRGILGKLKEKLFQWQKATFDPWLCSPHGVLLDGPTCAPLYNRLK